MGHISVVSNSKQIYIHFSSLDIFYNYIIYEENFFNEIAGGAEKCRLNFRPTYNYAKNIASPNDMGMSGDGNMDALAKDITGIIAYTQLLVEGKRHKQLKRIPLGNKFYLKQEGQY